MTTVELTLIIILIASNTVGFTQCSLSSNLRRLSIQVRGTSYTDGGSIPSFKPVSNSNIYSVKKLPSSFGRSKGNQRESNSLSRLVEQNGDVMNKSKGSFENVPFTITHTLRLILANKIIKSNPKLYPFEIEYKEMSSCQCRIDFEKVKRSYMEKNNLKELAGESDNEDSSGKDDLYESIFYTDFAIPDSPPDCIWSDSTKRVLDKLLGNNTTDKNDTSSEPNTENNYLIDNNDPTSNIPHNMHALQELINVDTKNDLEKENVDLGNLTSSINGTNELREGSNGLEEGTSPSLSSVIIRSLDGLLQCIYRIPVDFTPWRRSVPEYWMDKVSNSSDYWLNYTALNSESWGKVDFRGDRQQVGVDEVGSSNEGRNQTRFSIEGFWDLIRLIPETVLNNLDTKDENTYNLCKSERDDGELEVIDALIEHFNISREDYLLPTFSLLNIQPYNLTYCSRPTGAELDMKGICPSDGLNSVYDYETKSCISITYTDSVAFCPLSYSHSKLWGSHRGGGGCHVKQRKYLPSKPKCDKPFVFNEQWNTCVVEVFSPGFPGCVEGSVYYDLQTCIMAYQVLKEYECPKGYTANLEENFLQKDISDIEYRKEVLSEASEHFSRYYHPAIQEAPMMTRKVNDSESGVQSKFITKKFKTDETKVKCFKKETDEVKYNGIGAPFCQNSTFSLKYDYTHSWMFEKGPRPYCEYQDIVMVDYKCPKGTISYDSYISSGNFPPIVYKHEFVNPYDTCIQVTKIPIQPKCTTREEQPFISIREPLNYFERTGIHVVTKEDIENIDRNSLYSPSEVIDNSLISSEVLTPEDIHEIELESMDSQLLEGAKDQQTRSEMLLPSFGNSKKNAVSEFVSQNQLPVVYSRNISNGDNDAGEDAPGRRRLAQNSESDGLSDKEKSDNDGKMPVAPISLYDAIVGKTDYVVKIICLKVVTAKPYLSCPENTVLVPSNTCKMKGYADFIVECPKGYKLDEEALLLLPPEHYRRAPPRCVSKQAVFTHYYCPPVFPEGVFRPFKYNITELYSLIRERMENVTLSEGGHVDGRYQSDSSTFDSTASKETSVEGGGVVLGSGGDILDSSDLKNETAGDNSTSTMAFDHFNVSNFRIDNIKMYNITNTRIFSMKSYGRTVVPSYSQKMCHEVELIKPLWTMPLLLRIFLENINSDKRLKN